MPTDPGQAPPQPPHPCCAHLRCKSMYYRRDERPGMLHDEEAMGYWCALTNVDEGPDRGAVSHEDCQPGRPCHQPGPPLTSRLS